MSNLVTDLKTLKQESENPGTYLKDSSINLDNIYQLTTKRFFDLTISLLFLLFVGWWLFLVISLLIVLESKGPVFYKQMRHGQNNVPFYCMKFRSMKFSPKGHFKQATKDDPRITKVGKFLRKTSLDELPQFLNVFMGEMSIVGPRPHAIVMNRDYSTKIENFMSRHMVKPGITGLAQAKGFRGEILSDFDINSRLKLDLFYIKKWSVLLDLKIIIMTINCLLFENENAY
ncbi:sugar transferase [Belliella marina]|uniref:Sugar transferase n=1 Tax=Belliella marina TaxID=1644146 RepID=A0ABW4VM76_9BACT